MSTDLKNSRFARLMKTILAMFVPSIKQFEKLTQRLRKKA